MYFVFPGGVNFTVSCILEWRRQRRTDERVRLALAGLVAETNMKAALSLVCIVMALSSEESGATTPILPVRPASHWETDVITPLPSVSIMF